MIKPQGGFEMKKLFLFTLVFSILFTGCAPQKEFWDYRPMIYFYDGFYGETNYVLSSAPEGWTKTDEITKQVPSHEPPAEENGSSNALYVGTPIYTNPFSPELIYAQLDENKFIAYVFIEKVREPGTTAEPGDDITTVPLVNIGGTRWITSGTKPAPEPPEDCIIGTIDAYSNYAYEHSRTNIPGCVGQPYALVEGIYYVYCSRHPFQNESFEFYYGPGWLECHTNFGNPHSSISSSTLSESKSSEYENPYSDCVPEWSISSHSSEPSHVHSTDTSSNISAENNTSQNSMQSGITSSSLPENTSH